MVITHTPKQLLLRDLVVALFALVLGLGLATLWHAIQAPATAPLTPAPEIQQADGSKVLAQTPVAELPKPPHVLPKGAKLKREVTLQVQAEPTPDSPIGCSCQPADVALSLVDMPDGRERVVASVEGGKLLGGEDLVLNKALDLPPQGWAAGVSLALTQDRAPGIWLERDLWRARLRVEAVARRESLEPRVSVGWSW